MPNITSIPAPRVPFVDDRTGLISREWYRFMLNLFTLTGSGTSDLTITDLAIAPNPVDPSTVLGSAIEQSQLASITAQYSQFLDIVGVAPIEQAQMPLFEDLAPVAIPYVAPTAAEEATVLAATIHAATGKTTPVDNDELPLVDSAASNVLKKLTWANLKATLASWIGGNLIAASLTSVTSSGQIKTTLANGGGSAAPFLASHAIGTGYGWAVTGQAADGKNWDAIAVGTTLSVRAVNDANSSAAVALQVTRSGTSITAVDVYVGGTKVVAATSAGITVTGTMTATGTVTTPGGATFHTTNTALTNGAAAAAGTLLNAPAAGNPTKWIGINDNGTTRYIPAW